MQHHGDLMHCGVLMHLLHSGDLMQRGVLVPLLYPRYLTNRGDLMHCGVLMHLFIALWIFDAPWRFDTAIQHRGVLMNPG